MRARLLDEQLGGLTRGLVVVVLELAVHREPTLVACLGSVRRRIALVDGLELHAKLVDLAAREHLLALWNEVRMSEIGGRLVRRVEEIEELVARRAGRWVDDLEVSAPLHVDVEARLEPAGIE